VRHCFLTQPIRNFNKLRAKQILPQATINWVSSNPVSEGFGTHLAKIRLFSPWPSKMGGSLQGWCGCQVCPISQRVPRSSDCNIPVLFHSKKSDTTSKDASEDLGLN
jgi:hypothetical protein